MTQPTPAAEMQADRVEPSAHCSVCESELDPIISNLWRRYDCGKILWWIDGAWEPYNDVGCGNAEAAAVAQRQRADALAAQVETLRAALESVCEYCTGGLIPELTQGLWVHRLPGRNMICHMRGQYAALAAAPDDTIRTAVHGSTNIGNLATYNSWDEPPPPTAGGPGRAAGSGAKP